MPTISATPNPVDQGAKLKICYNFTPNDDENEIAVELGIVWTPDGLEPSTVWISRSDPCTQITIPDTAEALVIQDHTDGAPDETVSVNP